LTAITGFFDGDPPVSGLTEGVFGGADDGAGDDPGAGGVVAGVPPELPEQPDSTISAASATPVEAHLNPVVLLLTWTCIPRRWT
jgi:hypothetical protein